MKPIKPMIFQTINISISFLNKYIIMHRRMLGSAFDIGTFDFSRMLICQCMSLFRFRPLLPMTSLKAIKRQSGVLLDRVECKIRTTSTRHIKTIVFNH